MLKVGGSVFVLGGISYFLFREEVHDFLGESGADVASKTLESEELRKKAQMVSQTITQNILLDDQVRATASQFVVDILRREEIRTVALDLFVRLLSDPATVETVRTKLREIVLDLLRDPATEVQVRQLVLNLLMHADTQTALLDLLGRVIHQEETVSHFSRLTDNVLATDLVKDQVHSLSKETTERVLTDSDTRELLGNLAKDVLHDPDLQRSASDAAFRVAVQALVPRIFQGSQSKSTQQPVPNAAAATPPPPPPAAAPASTLAETTAVATDYLGPGSLTSLSPPSSSSSSPPPPLTPLPEERATGLTIASGGEFRTPVAGTLEGDVPAMDAS